MEKVVTYKKHNLGYGVLTLNRPNKRNAISAEVARELKVQLNQAKDEKLKFLVVTGAGNKMFSAGGDLNELHGELSAEEAYERLHPMKEILELLIAFPVPVVGLLNGDALGGGCELATACDIRIAKEGTSFGFVQSNLGILPGWGGGAILYKKVAPSFALDWLVRGNIFTAQELKEKRWVHQIISQENWTNQEVILEDFTNKSIAQMRLLKKQFLQQIQTEELKELMEMEVKNSSSIWDTEQHRQAVQRFLEKK